MRIVPALDRGLRILHLLAQTRVRMRVSDIAETLGIPRSATYELIFTLASHGAVKQYDNGEVGLGHQMLVLGSAYSRDLDFGLAAQNAAQSLMKMCQETVQVATLHGRHVLYVAKADSMHLVRLVSTVGVQLPAHCTAIGKVLLAFLPPEILAERFAGVTLEGLTERSITDPRKLADHLRQVREQGFASEICESNADVACVAAPIWNAQGKNIAAISISVPLARMNEQRMAELRDAVIAGAASFSAHLGFAALDPAH